MSTTFEPQIAPHFTGGSTLHDPQGGGTGWVSTDPLTTVPVPPWLSEPPVQVAAPPRIKTHSVAAHHRHSIARSREDTIDGWVGCVVGCVTVVLDVHLVTILFDLISMSAG